MLELPPHFDDETAEPGGGTVERFRDGSRRIIRAALAANGGRVYGAAGAARALGLKPSTLQSKMLKLGIKGAGRAGR
ncbi:MAG: hypothetical protein JNK82_29315 [Myxococcaceae bacterium]|nr:hypothetical protein [Myxococcaceae bacterium]